MTEHITVKKLRNKANAKKLKERKKLDYLDRCKGKVIPIPMDVFLEKIQGIDHETVIRVMAQT